LRLPRREFLSTLAALPLACGGRVLPPRAERLEEIVDLTHPLGPGSPYIVVRDATFPFRRAPIAVISERGVYANRWELTEHIGTHVDAPCHFAEGTPCLEAIAIQDLFAAAVVIDVRERAAVNHDTEVTVADVAAWESAHGPLPARCAVLLRSGWDSRWPSQERFSNADASGVMHFPGFARETLEVLARRPEVLGVGTDTFSIDPGRDSHYEGHRVWSTAGKWAIECLANLSRLPARGSRILAAALRVENASGGPARVIAWV
jgi:kynurenine formamidase